MNAEGTYVFYNGNTYSVTSAHTTDMGKVIGVKKGWKEIRITIHTIPGMDDHRWIAVRDQGSAQSSVYEVVETKPWN